MSNINLIYKGPLHHTPHTISSPDIVYFKDSAVDADTYQFKDYTIGLAAPTYDVTFAAIDFLNVAGSIPADLTGITATILDDTFAFVVQAATLAINGSGVITTTFTTERNDLTTGYVMLWAGVNAKQNSTLGVGTLTYV